MRVLGTAVVAAGFFLPSALAQDGATGADSKASYQAPIVTESLMLDAVRTGAGMVAVGEHGHIVLSDDDGESWRQVAVPTRSALTGVAFADEQHGFAVGHDAVILRTVDAGASWERIYFDPDYQTPLLDVWAPTPDRVVAVGAYGLYLESQDGGESFDQRTFKPLPLPLADDGDGGGEDAQVDDGEDEEDDYGIDYHLNQIATAADGTLYLAGEAGNLYRSDDDGATWFQLLPPYEGSFFGALPLADGALLAFGMRGNLFRSDDKGVTYEPIDTGVDALLTAGFQRNDGSVVIVGLAGVVLESRDGETFTLYRQSDRKGAMMTLPAADGAAVLVGEAGVIRLSQSAYRNGGAP